MRLVQETRGQAIVLSIVSLAALFGMCALVLDVGSWFRADRSTQATADAAALAAVQELPDSPGTATSVAITYADKNGGGVTSSDVTISSSLVPNDTVKVHVARTAPAFFSKVLGLGDVTVGSTATARAYGMDKAKYVAPITVNQSHPLLAGGGCPCFGSATAIPLGKNGKPGTPDAPGAPGAFDLLNLDGSGGGTSPGTLAGWMLNGYDDYLSLGDYYSDPGAKFDSSQMQSALNARIGTELLFPVYDTLSANGANAHYHVIGWVGFHLTGFDARGSSDGELDGYFTEIIWEGLAATTGGNGGPNFGAHTVRLVN